MHRIPAGQVNISEAPTVTPDAILQLGFRFMASKTLLSAVELGVFTALAEGPAHAESLRRRLGLHPRAARDFFDSLVALGMLEREEGIYSNSKAAAIFLDQNKQTYVGGIVEMANSRLYHTWRHLTESLRTGHPPNESVGGMGGFEALYADPARLREFAKAMTSISQGSAHAIAASFPWKDYNSFADIGCAEGGVPVVLSQTHAHLTGIGFDLPALQPLFDDYVATFGLSERVRFQPGNLFTDVLPRADVLILGHILHGWGLVMSDN